jgi:hypothetical protein
LVPPLSAAQTALDLWDVAQWWSAQGRPLDGFEAGYNQRLPVNAVACWGGTVCSLPDGASVDSSGYVMLNGACDPATGAGALGEHYGFKCAEANAKTVLDPACGAAFGYWSQPVCGGFLTWLAWTNYTKVGGAKKGKGLYCFRYLVNPAGVFPGWRPFVPPRLPLPGVVRTIDPLSVAPGATGPEPQPLPHWAVPHRRSNPMRSPVEGSSWGYDEPEPVGTPSPAPAPEEVRAVEVYPGDGGHMVPTPPEHRRERPGRDVKEGKTSIASGALRLVFRVAKRGINAATESGDVVDAIYEAIPFEVRKHWRKKGADGKYHDPRLLKKVELLYENWSKVDTSVALKNIALNELEDAVIGISHHYVNKGLLGTGYYRSPVGYGTGPAT